MGMDDRDLSYNKHLSEGEQKFSNVEDYTSENTTRLTVKEIEKMLLDQSEIIAELSRGK